jgi:hypothetical protein
MFWNLTKVEILVFQDGVDMTEVCLNAVTTRGIVAKRIPSKQIPEDHSGRRLNELIILIRGYVIIS